MAKAGRPTKDKYFETIPREVEVLLDKEENPKDIILENLKERFKKRQEREILVKQKQDLHRKIYNLSLEIQHIDALNETLMLKSGMIQ